MVVPRPALRDDHGGGPADWLMFLGAGASVAPPTCLPLFRPLAAGVLEAMGWQEAFIREKRAWIHSRYPSFGDPDVSAEVLFGALQRFGVSFAEQLTAVFTGASPGAVHQVAASVLQAGGCVWTTNVDMAVEAACEHAGFSPVLVGRASDRAPDLLRPLDEAGPGTLVKVHGTVQQPDTMAFTDRELMSPLSAADVTTLAALADGRTVVVYGYAGADADIADLLDEVFTRAQLVVWFEPFQWIRDEIVAAYRHHRSIRFQPDHLERETARDISATANEFLTLAASVGVAPEGGLTQALLAASDPPGAPGLDFETPPGIAQARLVERFGAPSTHDDAIWAARWDDLQHLRWRTARAHARWWLTSSLYGTGVVARGVHWLAGHRTLLALVRPRGLRDYVITRQCGLLLPEGRWKELGEFAQWAINTRSASGRPYPTDLYYRAHARRYDLRPTLAAQDARAAAEGLASVVVTDPERLAGAVLEAGMAAVYTARFEDALARAFDLHSRRGRYAIQRWRGWGHWLAAIANCHLGHPDRALADLDEAERRFVADGRGGPVNDVLTARLLALRVSMAGGTSPDHELLEYAATRSQSGRYKEDLELILADIDLGQGEHEPARRRLEQVAAAASNEISSAMSELGLAEVQRLKGYRDRAAEMFLSLGWQCAERGATWLATQAAIGVQLCDDPGWQPLWRSVARALPGERRVSEPVDLAIGNPRVLWLLTI